MKNDLISRSALLKDIKEIYTDEFLAEYGFDKLVEAQSTGYNVEKVVEQLRKVGIGGECRNYCKKYDWTVGACSGDCTEYVIEKAVEIVQKGGKVE